MLHQTHIVCIGSPLPTRGTPTGGRVAAHPHRITPAYAGNTLLRPSTDQYSWDHPHLRGEHKAGTIASQKALGSPPPTRGTHSLCSCAHRYNGITFLRGMPIQTYRPAPIGITGSPPPTRGTHDIKCASALIHRITPAYAGNTRCALQAHPRRQDHLRLRGEHALIFDGSIFAAGSPPPTRGTRAIPRRNCLRIRITPAYAGNTARAEVHVLIDWDHPRLRGEHTKGQIWPE